MPNAILDPTGTVTSSAAKPAAPRAPRPASLQGKRVSLLINTKQNARPFLEEVGRLLEQKYDVTLTQRTKVNFAVPEPEDVIKELVAGSDVVITGVGDCGSCSAAAAADGVVLEAAGLPVAAIITESFVPTADAMAALRGAPGYQYATTAHPVAVLTQDKVKERAAQVLDDVVALLVADTQKAEA
ncbi:MAG: UGSC family (seleno)protein [Trebonia sp.]